MFFQLSSQRLLTKKCILKCFYERQKNKQMKGNWTGPILNRLFFWACQFLYFWKICLCICVTWWIISFFRVLHEARFDASQTPLETPSLFTAAAFSSRFLPSDRNITRLLLLISCDMTSVERTFLLTMYSARCIATDQHNHLPRIGGCTKIYSQTIVLLGICFIFYY